MRLKSPPRAHRRAGCFGRLWIQAPLSAALIDLPRVCDASSPHTHTHTHTHTDQTTIGCTYVCVWDGSVCRIPGYSAVGSDWVLERLQTDAPNKRSRVSPQQKNEWTLSQKVHCLSRGGLLATRRRVWPCVCVWPCGRVAVWPCGRVCVFFACTHTHPQESTGGCSRKCRDSRAS